MVNLLKAIIIISKLQFRINMFEQSYRNAKLSTHTRLNIQVQNPDHNDSANLSSDEDIPEELTPVKNHGAHIR